MRYVISALPVLFIILDGVMKLIMPEPVAASFTKLGYPQDLSVVIGSIELACVAVYLMPRTAAIGAVLLTGFLGGAVATHVRIGDPLFTHILFPTYVAAFLWGGLFLRDQRVRALLRSPKTAH